MRTGMMISVALLLSFTLGLVILFAQAAVFAYNPPAEQIFPTDPTSNKFLSAAIAFSSAAIAAGWAISRAGSAGLAGTAERPEIRTTAIIITALGEALAIYGIVIAILILTQAV